VKSNGRKKAQTAQNQAALVMMNFRMWQFTS
jgi:hypothetical protein